MEENENPVEKKKITEEEDKRETQTHSFHEKFIKIFKIDPILAIPLVLFLLHIRLWTFLILACVWGFFGILWLFGMSINDFRKWLRSQI